VIVEHYWQLLLYYRKVLITIVVGITGAVAALSYLWLVTFPLYTATADVTILPTDAELSFTKGFVTASQYNPANIMTQTQIEYLLSRPVAEKALELVAAHKGGERDPPPTGVKQKLSAAAQATLRTLRKIYNILNSGKHVPLTPYEDAVETLMDSITLEVVEGSYVLEISVTLPQRGAVAIAANSLADAYVQKVQEDTAVASAAMTRFLEAEIAKRVDMLGRVSDREAAMLQSEIAATRDRLAGVEMSKASVLSQVRVINPAVTPIYATYPKIVIYTAIGFAASLVIAAFVVVVIDTVTNTVKTLPDLRRLAGERALGRITPSIAAWMRGGLKPRHKGQDQNFGKFASDAISRIVAFSGVNGTAIQVTGFGQRDDVGSVAVAMAAALAQAGRNVLCDRRIASPANDTEPADTQQRIGIGAVSVTVPSERGASNGGHLIFGPSVGEGSAAPDAAVICHGPMEGNFSWEQLTEGGSIVVCVPAGKVTEGMVGEFKAEAERHGFHQIFFVLTAA
jgi:uncharacterized protein involved in exopolysaccharide biosynthesis